MQQTVEYLIQEGEDRGETREIQARLPNSLPARLTNECEAEYKATLKAGNGSQSAKMDDPFNAVKNIKEKVLQYLTTDYLDGVQWIEKDLDSSQITNGNEIVGNYEEDLYGIQKKSGNDSKEKPNAT